MSNIVCNFVEFVFLHEIETMEKGSEPVLKLSVEWKNIIASEKPVYVSSIKQSDAGPTNEETVSVKARKNNLTKLLIKYCGFHTVLRMTTDREIFYVGNLEYPCQMELTDDKVFDNFSFRAVSPV